MPSAQVIDFGEDPYANAMGGFAKNFLGALNKRTAEKRNDELFGKIKEKYGPDAKAEDIFRDVLKSEGLDQEYKRNKLDEIKQLAELDNKKELNQYQKALLEYRKQKIDAAEDKKNGKKPLTDFQKRDLKLKKVRLKLEKSRLKIAAGKQARDLPEKVDKYTSTLLKNADVKMAVHDKADLNSFVSQLMEEDGLGIDDAFNKANAYITARNDKVDEYVNGEATITKNPQSWFGNKPGEIESSMKQAVSDLNQLYEEDGIENQKDLREIAMKAGWNKDQANAMLQMLFQQKGKKMLGRKTKASASPSAETTAKIPLENQGEDAEFASLKGVFG